MKNTQKKRRGFFMKKNTQNKWKSFGKMSALAFLMAGAVLFTSACGMRVSAAELTAGYSRRVSADSTPDDAFLASLNAFSFDLWQQTLEKDGENHLFSPLSAALCLGMLSRGADGQTKAEFEQMFGVDMDTFARGMLSYVSGLYTDKNCHVALADSLWIKEGFSVKDSFLQDSVDYFDAQVYRTTMDDSTVKDINAWVRKNTDGLIDKIYDSMDAQTVMVLINSLLFDAKWETKYEKSNISPMRFTAYDGTVTQKDALHSEEHTYLKAEDVVGFAKNYEGGAYSFVGLLPVDEDADIYDFAATLTAEKWQALWNSRMGKTVNVSMPEFSFADEIKLNDPLVRLGLSSVFDSSAANLAGMTDEDVFCSEVAQKTFIQVDRNGTKAAAITWEDVNTTAMREEYSVVLNRPFVCAIVDNATGLPLFLSVVASV